MGTRFLFTTKKKLGGTTIQLKHKGLWLTAGDANTITGMIARARLMLSTTIAAISDGTCDAQANTYFLGTPSASEWLAVSAKLELIMGGLNTDLTLKLGGDGAFGFVRRSNVPSTSPGAVLFPNGAHYSREGHTIHVSKKRLLTRGEELGVITIIHEASHKYANTFDHGDAGYREQDDSGWEAPGMTMAEALDNADSYGYFVYRVGESMGV
jgi:hypothetical protein